VTIFLPGQKHVLDSSKTGTGELRNSLSDASLYVKIVSFARTGEAEQAEFYLRQLLSSPRMLRGCPLTSGSAIDRASECATHKYNSFLSEMGKTLDSSSASASGTLTINNGDNINALYLLLSAAEVARSRKDPAEYDLLKRAFEYQKMLQYDEPAPFFYPIGETLAGFLLRRSQQGDLDEAETVLRTVLFQWPRSALASLAMHSVLARKGAVTESAYALADAVRFNDTELSLDWL
jgi:hypothetical protein